MNTNTTDNFSQSLQAPEAEPERQYYFMDRARQLLREKIRQAGRPLTFCVVTFGCQNERQGFLKSLRGFWNGSATSKPRGRKRIL